MRGNTSLLEGESLFLSCFSRKNWKSYKYVESPFSPSFVMVSDIIFIFYLITFGFVASFFFLPIIS